MTKTTKKLCLKHDNEIKHRTTFGHTSDGGCYHFVPGPWYVRNAPREHIMCPICVGWEGGCDGNGAVNRRGDILRDTLSTIVVILSLRRMRYYSLNGTLIDSQRLFGVDDKTPDKGKRRGGERMTMMAARLLPFPLFWKNDFHNDDDSDNQMVILVLSRRGQKCRRSHDKGYWKPYFLLVVLERSENGWKTCPLEYLSNIAVRIDDAMMTMTTTAGIFCLGRRFFHLTADRMKIKLIHPHRGSDLVNGLLPCDRSNCYIVVGSSAVVAAGGESYTLLFLSSNNNDGDDGIEGRVINILGPGVVEPSCSLFHKILF